MNTTFSTKNGQKLFQLIEYMKNCSKTIDWFIYNNELYGYILDKIFIISKFKFDSIGNHEPIFFSIDKKNLDLTISKLSKLNKATSIDFYFNKDCNNLFLDILKKDCLITNKVTILCQENLSEGFIIDQCINSFPSRNEITIPTNIISKLAKDFGKSENINFLVKNKNLQIFSNNDLFEIKLSDDKVYDVKENELFSCDSSIFIPFKKIKNNILNQIYLFFTKNEIYFKLANDVFEIKLILNEK